MIEHLSALPDGVLAFVYKGRVRKADYDTVVTPAVVDALKTHPRLRLYLETSEDFTGMDAGAMWEDFSVGMEHLTHWDRVAVVTDVEWIEQATRLYTVILPCNVKIFPTSETAAARAWIAATARDLIAPLAAHP